MDSKKSRQQNDTGKTLSYQLVEDLYVSPAVKRSIWRTLLLVKEIVSVQGAVPKRIFVEMARGATENQKNQRTVSRKESLLKVYYKKDNAEYLKLYEALKEKDDNQLRSDKLYLYFIQFGKCAYSGEPIDLGDLFDNNRYDIDHIYPQSKTKDDSLDNRVLVKRELNQKVKGDKYPIPDSLKTAETLALWRWLRDAGTISKEKYYRLTRNTALTNDESGYRDSLC